MLRVKTEFILAFMMLFFSSWKVEKDPWIIEKYFGYDLYYTTKDVDNKDVYIQFVDNGLASVTKFFDSAYKQSFDIYVHPNRNS